jgi:hypothetical protein
MRRTLSALTIIVAGSIAFAGLSAFPGCGYRGPAMPEAGGFPPDDDGAKPKGGLKIEVPVADSKPDPKPDPIPDVNNNGRRDREDTNAAALADFHAAVKKVTGWLMGLVGAATVAALLLSFTPFAVVSWQKSMIGFGVVGALLVGRLALLKNGELAADILSWGMLGLSVLAIVPVVWIVTLWWKNKILVMQGKRLAAEGNPRESTALLAAGNEKVNVARKEVALWITQLQTATGTDRVKLLGKLREKGINL